MKLTKKHIGKLFDNEGSDGSWTYQLVDLKKGWMLFYVLGSDGRFEAEPQTYTDWRCFKPQSVLKANYVTLKQAWERARGTP